MERIKLEQKGCNFEGEVAFNIQSVFRNALFVLNKGVYSPFLGKDTQIDLIVILPSGIYVIEAKNWPGFIKGEFPDKYWKGRGQGRVMNVINPVHQNMMHCRSLRLHIANKGFFIKEPFINLVVVPDSTMIYTESKEVMTVTDLLGFLKKREKFCGNRNVSLYYKIISEN